MKSGAILSVKTVECLGCGLAHLAKRSDARCAECRKKKHRAKAARRRERFPELCQSELAAWRLRNPEKVKSHKRKFQQENRAHRSFYERTREATKAQATPSWADLDAIKGMYELCGVFRRVGLDLHVDHIVPIKGRLVCGLHVAENLQLLHAADNMKKKNLFV